MRGRKVTFGPQHAAAERALHAAVTQHGRQVTGAEILAAWRELSGEVPPTREALEQRWERVFTFGLRDGRVVRTRRPGGSYWVPADRQDLPIPDGSSRLPRVYSERLLERSRLLEDALRSLVAARGQPVRVRDLKAYLRTHGEGGAALAELRIVIGLGPAIEAGRVVYQRVGRQMVLTPAEGSGPRGATNIGPAWSYSGLARLEEALRRAVNRWQSPVPPGLIAKEFELANDLELEAKDGNLLHATGSLVRTKRAIALRLPGRTQGRVYFTTPDGPRAFAPEVLRPNDRRWLAVQGVWSAARGRPFSTPAVRAWTRRHASGWFPSDPPYAWVNALSAFERAGELVAIRDGQLRDVRWAPAAEWARLSEAERARRLRDVWRESRSSLEAGGPAPGDVEQVSAELGRPGAPLHDAAFRSMARNLTSLVRLAQRLEAERATSAADCEIIQARPVTLAELRRIAAANPKLIRPGTDVKSLLVDATRRRKHARGYVVLLGTVGRERFFAEQVTDAGLAYLRYRAALWHAGRTDLLRVAADLEAASALSASGTIAVGQELLGARMHSLVARMDAVMATLRAAADAAVLLETERLQVDKLLGRLRDARQRATGICPMPEVVPVSPTTAEPELPDDCLIDPGTAAAQVACVMPRRSFNGGVLAHYLGLRTRLVPLPEQRRLGRRRALRFLDRIGFGAAAMGRWGGHGLRTLATLGGHYLGDLRDRTRVQQQLSTESPEGLVGAIAALGLFDDPTARAAVLAAAQDLRDAFVRFGHRVPPAVAAAISFALAPKPAGGLATEARTDELDVLGWLAEHLGGQPVGAFAAAVRRAWVEAWDPAQVWTL